MSAKDELAAAPVYAILGIPGLTLGLFMGWHWALVILATVVSGISLSLLLIIAFFVAWAIMGD